MAPLNRSWLPSRQGGLLALPVPDTLKRAARSASDEAPSGPPRVGQTLIRAGLWMAQTPQMFRGAALMRALEEALEAGVEGNDDASAMAFVGGQHLSIKDSVI